MINAEANKKITAVRCAMVLAEQEALALWAIYADLYIEDGIALPVARAQGATHLPDDIRAVLGIDRYGSYIK